MIVMKHRPWEKLRGPGQRLSWKLTLSYTLVTVITVIVVEGIALGMTWLMVFSTATLPRQLATILYTYAAPELVPLLKGPTVDIEGIKSWLGTFYTQGVTIEGENTLQVSAYAGSTGSETVVVDAGGNFLASIPADLGTFGRPFIPKREGAIPAPLSAALAGETDTSKLYGRSEGDWYIIAVPVQESNGDILGALYFTGNYAMLSAANYFPTIIKVFVLPSLIAVTIAAGVLGTFFGFLTARGLTRRLQTLATTADAWGNGDFAAKIPDDSKDEIGQLGLQLNRMAEQVQGLLSTRQQLATIEERNRLARELHDSVKQQIFAATMNLGAAEALWERDPGNARAKVADVKALLQESQQELKALIHELRPIALEGKGLAAALADYAEEWSTQTGIQAHLQVQGKHPTPLYIEQALFRVVQEALSNVGKHSRAAAAEILLDQGTNKVSLTITDTGCGFDPATVQEKGLGLHSMRERIEALNGTFQVISNLGEGTQILVTLPLPEALPD